MTLAESATIVPMRKHAKVPFADIEGILNQALQCSNGVADELARTLGYANGGTFNEWRKSGEVPLRAKYMLIGFLTEMRILLERKVVKQFDPDELALLFGILIGASLTAEQQRSLKTKIAKELASA